MTFTRRHTGFTNPADFVFLFDGKEVGRCYRSHFGMEGQSWRWSIYGRSLCGIEPTIEVAQDKFKEAYAHLRATEWNAVPPSA